MLVIHRTLIPVVCVSFLWGSSQGSAQERFEFVIPGDDSIESVVSQQHLLDAPVKLDEFVRVEEGRFYHGSKRLRFWGMNVCFSANFPPHDVADKLAPHLAKLGVNAVRFHHMDNQNAPGGIWAEELVDGQRIFDEEMVDRLDYFLAKLHEQEIYADLNLHVSRTLGANEGFPALQDVPWWANYNKWAMYYDPDIQRELKRYCRLLLTHPNPYRGNRRRADDPGIAVIEMLNENYFSEQGYSLYDRLPEKFQLSLIAAWNRWLSDKYNDTKTLVGAWNDGQTGLGECLVTSDNWDQDFEPWELSGSRDSEKCQRQWTADPAGVTAISLAPLRAFDEQHAVQLSRSGLSTVAGTAYTLAYDVQADARRNYNVELSTSAGGEWRELGCFETKQATPQWQHISMVIIPRETVDGEANFRFSFGSDTTPIRFANVTLHQGIVVRELQPNQTLEMATIPIPDDGASPKAHADMEQFMRDTEVAWVSELKTYLRGELGVKVPIAASQVNYHTPEVNLRQNDFIDLHNYWHHPLFPADAPWSPTRWTVGNEPMEAKPTHSGWPANSLLMRSTWRYAGKPMTLSEWNYPEPSPYSSGCVPAAAIIASLQDWDGVFFFQYESGAKTAEDWFRDHTTGFFDFNGQPVKLANFTVFANLFLRGDLPAIREQVVAKVGSPISGQYGLAVRASVAESAEGIAADLADLDVSNLTTADGTVRWIADGEQQGWILIDTEKTQGVIGTIGGHALKTSRLAVTDVSISGVNYGTMVATAQDNRPLHLSKKILLLASSHSENQQMGWNEARNSVGTNWGTGPTSVAALNATVMLSTNQPLRVFALDGKGRPKSEVATEFADGQLSFQLTPGDKTLWYELVSE